MPPGWDDNIEVEQLVLHSPSNCLRAIPTDRLGYHEAIAMQSSWEPLCPRDRLDYAPRFPEAVPLLSFEAEWIAEELIK